MDVFLTTNDWAVVLFLIPIIVALGEAAKTLGINTIYIPLIDISFGILGSIFFVPSAHGNLPMGFLIGIIAGLSACGLYSTGKNTMQKIKNGGK